MIIICMKLLLYECASPLARLQTLHTHIRLHTRGREFESTRRLTVSPCARTYGVSPVST